MARLAAASLGILGLSYLAMPFSSIVGGSYQAKELKDKLAYEMYKSDRAKAEELAQA